MKTTGGVFMSLKLWGHFYVVNKSVKKKNILDSVTELLCVAHSFDEATGTMDAGYPRSIEDDFPGMDDEIDAAAYHYGTVIASNRSISSSN